MKTQVTKAQAGAVGLVVPSCCQEDDILIVHCTCEATEGHGPKCPLSRLRIESDIA